MSDEPDSGKPNLSRRDMLRYLGSAAAGAVGYGIVDGLRNELKKTESVLPSLRTSTDGFSTYLDESIRLPNDHDTIPLFTDPNGVTWLMTFSTKNEKNVSVYIANRISLFQTVYPQSASVAERNSIVRDIKTYKTRNYSLTDIIGEISSYKNEDPRVPYIPAIAGSEYKGIIFNNASNVNEFEVLDPGGIVITEQPYISGRKVWEFRDLNQEAHFSYNNDDVVLYFIGKKGNYKDSSTYFDTVIDAVNQVFYTPDPKYANQALRSDFVDSAKESKFVQNGGMICYIVQSTAVNRIIGKTQENLQGIRVGCIIK